MLKENDNLPEFDLMGTDGKKHNSKDYKGKKLIIYFFPNIGTPMCTLQAKDFTKMKKEFTDKGYTIIGVNHHSNEIQTKFVTDFKLGVLLLSNPEGDVLKDFGILEQGGFSRSTFLISVDQKIDKAIYNVSGPFHANMVLKQIKKLK